MGSEVIVHERVMRRHPELTKADIRYAWRNAFVMQRRWLTHPSVIAAVGVDMHGRAVEMVGVETEDGGILVYHAYTPPTSKTISELGLRR